MNRRNFLALAALGIAARAQKPSARIEVVLNQEIGRISPLIYGHFAEHVGNLIYDGIWVGPESRIPNKRGYRIDTLEALKKVRPGAVRWPGGCFADAYDWREGIGPLSGRVQRRNLWWARDEPNTFGTDEFLAGVGTRRPAISFRKRGVGRCLAGPGLGRILQWHRQQQIRRHARSKRSSTALWRQVVGYR